jgi:uncharacterized membrane protein
MEDIKLNKGIPLLVSTAVMALVMAILMHIMKVNGYYASGNDIWGHLFKSDLMYQNISRGNFYPLYTERWYNGIQPFRYWAPLPYYLMSVLQYLANGDIQNAYYLFAGFSFFAGGLGWLLWGLQSKRIYLCSFIGIIWFFMPENIRVFFCEGNLPRMVTTILVPYIVLFLMSFVDRERNISIIPLICFMSLMVLCHVMLAAMMGVGTFIFLFFYCISMKKVLRPFYALTAMALSFALCGIWLFPALKGGLVGMDPEASASVMKMLTYSLSQTLNPFIRINGVVDTFYYSSAVVVISITGILLANMKEKSGFYTAILILLATTTSAVPFLSKLPLNQLLWMMRFATIAYALFFCSLISWKKCKRYFLILLSITLLIDCLPSFGIQRYYTQLSGVTKEDILIAKAITQQRVAIIDLSAYGSYPSWGLAEGKNPVNYTYGWAWQGAATSSNIVLLNTAMEKGYFEYMFDRCLELGDDTVIIRKELLEKANKTYAELINSALKSEYELYKETNHSYIFHRNVSSCFGVVTYYKGLTIGKSASQLSLLYPEFTLGCSDNIEDYTIDELSKYKVIYLSGFTFNNRASAENMVQRLGRNGIRVIIDMNRIPADKTTNRMTFLGVTAQDISFETMFPTLTYKGNKVIPQNFVKEYSTWNTVYLDKVKHIQGKLNYDGYDLTFLGTNDDKNIIFMGCNIIYHAMEAEDRPVMNIIEDLLQLKINTLPARRLVNLKITVKEKSICICSPENMVNTTLAYQDNFESADNILNQNNLLTVTKKHTEITLVYPYLKQGIFVTVFGGICLSILLFFIFTRNKTTI